MAITLLLEGKCPDARVEMTRLRISDLGPETILVRGMVGAVCGDRSAAQQAIQELYQRGSWSDSGASIIYAMSGDANHAFPALSRAIDEREVGVNTMKESAGFDRIRTDPRWRLLMARMHFPQ
jgi:hypothetical protein